MSTDDTVPVIDKCHGTIEINGEQMPCPAKPTPGGYTCLKHKVNYGQTAKKRTYTVTEMREKLQKMRSDYRRPQERPAF